MVTWQQVAAGVVLVALVSVVGKWRSKTRARWRVNLTIERDKRGD